MKQNQALIFYFILFFKLTFLISCQQINSTVKNPEIKSKTFWGIYIIGSNLESDLGLATQNLNEIVHTYNNLSNTEKSRINILISFGGSDKNGWNGIKYADIDCMVIDSKDGIYGNANCYSYKNEKANMAVSASLINFLKEVKTKSQGFSNNIFTLWDHGASYLGMGPDTYIKNVMHDKDSILTLKEINLSLSQVNNKFDIIGFDACLMASLEVAKSIKDYGSYMVASENLEPGEGWNYKQIVEYIAKNSYVTPVNIAKYITESYFNYSSEKKEVISKSKTMSVIELNKTDIVIQKFDALFSFLNNNIKKNFATVLRAGSSCENYGMSGINEVEQAIDIKDFILKIKYYNPETTYLVDNLLNEINSYIIFAKDDGTKPDSSGLSLVSLMNIPSKTLYDENIAISPMWISFINNFRETGINDLKAPIIEPISTTDTGSLISIKDDIGVKNVIVLNTIWGENNKYRVVSSKKLFEKEGDTFFVPKWDGNVIFLCNGECNEINKKMIIPIHNKGIMENGNYLLESFLKIDDDDILNYTEWDTKQLKSVFSWSVFYEIMTHENGESSNILSKKSKNLEKGDRVGLYYQDIDLEMNINYFTLDNRQISFTQQPVIKTFPLSGSRFTIIMAEDYKGNFTYSKPF